MSNKGFYEIRKKTHKVKLINLYIEMSLNNITKRSSLERTKICRTNFKAYFKNLEAPNLRSKY